MDRRRFIASLTGVAASASIPAAISRVGIVNAQVDTSQIAGVQHHLALPTADQIKWQDLEMGMFIHFAPNTWQGVEQDNLSTPLSEIDPKQLNTDQWASTAVDLGAKYIVFVAKHSGGFCMWQTETTKYSIGNTPWRSGHGDVLADVSASCRKFGLKLGVYVSPRDAKHGAGIGGLCKSPAQQKIYNAIYRRQLTEVLSRYGSMVEIWFDGSNVIPVGDILDRYAPHAMIFQGPHATIRWAGNENGFVPYPAWNSISAADAKTGVATALNSDPNGSVWMPNEVDVSILRPDWFWSPTSQRNLLTLDAMVEIYYRSIGRGAQLLLNIPPDTTGLMPADDVTRAKQFGEEIQRRFGKSVAETSGSGDSVMLPLPAGSRVDTFLMQEDCSFGERVRQYKIEARQRREVGDAGYRHRDRTQKNSAGCPDHRRRGAARRRRKRGPPRNSPTRGLRYTNCSAKRLERSGNRLGLRQSRNLEGLQLSSRRDQQDSGRHTISVALCSASRLG